MVLRGKARIKKYYPRWFMGTIIGLAIILFSNIRTIQSIPITKIFFWLVLILFLKDILIDIGGLKYILQRFTKTGPWPQWLEHNPIVICIFVVGLLGYKIDFFAGYVTQPTMIIAFIDAIIDYLDDIGQI